MVLGAVVGRRPADVVAHSRVLDLDDVGSEVGEEQRAEAPGQKPGEVENPYVVERAVHAAAVADSACDFSESPSICRASGIVATRRPTSSAIRRAFAINSPFERAISPFGR